MKLFDVYPLFDVEPVKGDGVFLFDKNGTQYLDLYGGHAVISVGHGRPKYVNDITQQLGKLGFYSNSVKNSPQEELATKLGKLSQYEDYSLFLCNSGAEANENALKLASFETGRKKIIAFKGSFHGRTSLAVATTDDVAIASPANENPNVIFLPLNDISALKEHLNETVAAVIIEGIQGVAGIKVPENDFFKEVSTLCKVAGVKLILDEVQSGFGRSGKFFAHQHADIKPDLITVAKGMGNGFPVAGVLIHPDIKPKHGMLGTTFGGNHLACVAAIAVLDIIESEDLIRNAEKMGNYLVNQLSQTEGVKEVRGKGLMLGIELEFPSAEIRKELLTEYKIFCGSAADKNTIRILPPLTVAIDNLNYFIKSFKAVVAGHYEKV